MVNSLLHLILPTTLNVQGHGVPHLTSSWFIILFQLLPWQPSYRNNLAVPFFSYTPYLLPSTLGFHAENVTCGTHCSAILIELKLESMRELRTGLRGRADGGYMFSLLSPRKTILKSFCSFSEGPSRRSPNFPQWPAQCECLRWLSLLPGFTLPSPLLLPGITSPNILLAWVSGLLSRKELKQKESVFLTLDIQSWFLKPLDVTLFGKRIFAVC